MSTQSRKRVKSDEHLARKLHGLSHLTLRSSSKDELASIKFPRRIIRKSDHSKFPQNPFILFETGTVEPKK